MQICCERRRQMHCWWVSDITIPLIVLTVLLSDIIDNNHVTIPLIVLTMLLSDIIHHNYVGAGRSKWFLCQIYHALCFYLILYPNSLRSSISLENRKVYRSQENIIFTMKEKMFNDSSTRVLGIMHNRRFCIFIS